MQAWLFLSDFWTVDRVKSYMSQVPIVRHASVHLRSIESRTRFFLGPSNSARSILGGDAAIFTVRIILRALLHLEYVA